MSKLSKKTKNYNCSQASELAHKLGMRGDIPHKAIAEKLAEYLGVSNKNHIIVLSNYFSNPTPILGFVEFIPQCKKIEVTSDKFLQSYEWRKLRFMAIKLHGRKCQCCGATPETGAVINVDHIKSRKTHPELALDINNLQVLCHECNHGKGNWDSTDFR